MRGVTSLAEQGYINTLFGVVVQVNRSWTREHLKNLPLKVCGPKQKLPRAATSVVSATSARLEARITPALHAMVKRAADLQGRTMTDFVVSVVQDAAQGAIEQAAAFYAHHGFNALPDSPLTLFRAFGKRVIAKGKADQAELGGSFGK